MYDVIDRQSHNRSCLLSHAGFSFLPTTTTAATAATERKKKKSD